MPIKKHIPNTITSLNLLSGCLSITFAFEGYTLLSVYMIFIAAVFDFLDGMSARLLKAYSQIGKELDSLADVVSFGAAPSVIVYQMMKVALFGSTNLPAFNDLTFTEMFLLITPFTIAIFSGVRLAVFNIDDKQSENFIGIPTPANALFFVSLFLVYKNRISPWANECLENELILMLIVFFFSYLLVSPFPMFSLKFKNLKINKNKIRYIFIVLSVILLILLQANAIPLIIILYILLSAINNWIYNLD